MNDTPMLLSTVAMWCGLQQIYEGALGALDLLGEYYVTSIGLGINTTKVTSDSDVTLSID